MKIGVLGLQGDVPEHRAALGRLLPPYSVTEVRRESDLGEIQGLILPGGESTALSGLIREGGLERPLRARLGDGLPVLATCAGLILMAKRLSPEGAGEEPVTLGGLDVTVRRNSYGRQVDSFEAPLRIPGMPGGPFPGVFIRAPRIVETGPGVEPIAFHGPEVVGVRQGPVWGLSFHPELSDDTRLHYSWLRSIGALPDQGTPTKTRSTIASATAPTSTAAQ
jgi:5'-phosphate synthase pdxT subunit